MSKFVFTITMTLLLQETPPRDTYLQLSKREIWKDNVPMTYGGDGHGSGQGSTTDLCNLCSQEHPDPDFPGQSGLK